MELQFRHDLCSHKDNDSLFYCDELSPDISQVLQTSDTAKISLGWRLACQDRHHFGTCHGEERDETIGQDLRCGGPHRSGRFASFRDRNRARTNL